MNVAAVIAACAVGALMLALPRLLSGPTLHDRALAAKTIVVRAIVVVAALAVALGHGALLDVALALGFASLALCAAVSKLFRARSFQPALSQAGER